MTDFRRSLLWVVFALSMVMLWDRWQVHNGNAPLFFAAPTTASAPAASGNADSGVA